MYRSNWARFEEWWISMDELNDGHALSGID